MIRPRSITIAYAAVLLVSAVSAQAQERGTEKLVPAVFQQLNDDHGNEWSFQQNGVLGRTSNSLMTGGLVLQIANHQFYNYQPFMTEDGLEYVLDNNQQNIGLQITRRIRLVEEDGLVRYLEIITNPTAATATTVVELRSNLGARFSGFYSDRGRPNPATLEKREEAIIVIPKTKGQKALAFGLGSHKAGLKPTITHQNEYQLNFHFPITLPPGGTTVLMHTVAQVDAPDAFDAKTLAKTLREVTLDRQMDTVPPEIRRSIANYSGSGAFGGATLLAASSIEGLGVERGRTDVLALGDRTRLVGEASSSAPLRVVASYGEAEIPFEEVAAVTGGPDGGRVFLRDGQVISGEIEIQELRFVMPSGAKLDLSTETLDRLVRKGEGGDGNWDQDAVALLETVAGDRIAIRGGEGSPGFRCVTPWGPVAFSLDEILWLSPPEDEPVGHHVVFRDGSRFFGFLTGGDTPVDTALFGPRSFAAGGIRSIVTRAAKAAADSGEVEAAGSVTGWSGGRPGVVLAGGQRLVGQIEADTIGAITSAELLELPPETIRRLHNLDGDSVTGDRGSASGPTFEVDLWGGGVIACQLREAVLPIRVRAEIWRVPVGDIIEIVAPLPQMSDASRQRIGELVRQLGSADWEARDAASEELATFGYMAKPLLLEATRTNPDPEVIRRAERLLDEID
ncbi:hypothetical protein BH23VER1_BH23VER1_08100 [soil metagenome]